MRNKDGFATVRIGASISHKGRTAVASAGHPATVALIGPGTSTNHKALASALETGYSFLQHSAVTISTTMSMEEKDVARKSASNLNPTSGIINYFINTVTMHTDDAKALDNLFVDGFYDETEIAGIIAAQRISATIAANGVDKVFGTAPGISPGTKIVPIQIHGMLSVNLCSEHSGANCTRSRPHLIAETVYLDDLLYKPGKPSINNYFKRINSAITLAKRERAFATQLAPFDYWVPATIKLVNETAITVTLYQETGSNQTITTYASGELTIVPDEKYFRYIPPFSPLLSPPGERLSLSQKAKDAITSGDGMAIVVAMTDSNTNDENGSRFKNVSSSDFQTNVVIGTVTYNTVSHGDQINYRIATDLSIPIPGRPGGQSVDVRDYGLAKALTINGTTVTTRSLSGYTNNLWLFPGHEALKPYWLSVVAANLLLLDIDPADGIQLLATVVIPGHGSGCGIAWERCITALNQGVVPEHNLFSQINDDFLYHTAYSDIAAAYVTGALALLKRYFPDIRADTATEILLTTATDIGDPGPDPVYGRGLLNIGRALNPVGRLSTSPGSSTFIDGSALKLSGALASLDASEATVVGYDQFSRPFGSSLGQFIEIQPRSAERPGAVQIIDDLQRRQLSAPVGGILHYRDQSLERFSWRLASDTSVSHDWCQLQCATGGDSWGFMAAGPQLTSLTRLRHSLVPESGIEIEAAMAGGPAEVAWRSLALRMQRQPAAGVEWGMEIGTAQEEDSLLGSELSGAFALADGAETRFVHLRGSWQLAENVVARGSLSRTHTQAAAQPDAVVLGISDLVAESATASLSTRGVLRRADALAVEWEVPLQATSGLMHLRTGGYNENGERFTGIREVALSTTGRERLWRISYAAPLASMGGSAWLGASAERRHRGAAHAGRDDWRYSLALVWKQ